MSPAGRRRPSPRPGERRTLATALVLLLAAGCGGPPAPGPEAAAPPPATDVAAAPEALRSQGRASCSGDLAATLVRFDIDEKLARDLRGRRGPLPLVTYGPEAGAEDGDENYRQRLRFRLPKETRQDLYLQIFDVDTGWSTEPDPTRPWDDQPAAKWNTATRFRLTGRDGERLLEHTTDAGKNAPGDQRWTSWGPIPLACAGDTGSDYELLLEVEGLSGDDGNVFLAGLSLRHEAHEEPAGIAVTAEAPTVRLLDADRNAAELLFAIPADTREVTVRNFDLARGNLRLETAHRSLALRPSGQGQAVDVRQAVDADESGRLAALIFSGGQENPNDVTFGLSDDQDRALEVRLPALRRDPARANRPPVARATSRVEADCRTVSFDSAGTRDPDGDELELHWDFGDGETASGPSATHVYAAAGAYQGRLLVRDDSGAVLHAGRRTFERRIWSPPTAEAGADRVGAPGVAVELDGTASTDPDGGELRYRWDFGDGARGSGGKVSHRWRRPGTYEVVLEVEDDGEAPCHRDSAALTVVINAPPVAEAGAARRSVGSDATLDLDGSASVDPEGGALRYRWDLGDGNTAEGARVSHRYGRPGTYRASLTVTDPSGAPNDSATDAVEVFVNSPPQPVATAELPACAGGSPPCFESCDLAVELDASGSEDADGDRLTYSWELGDGSLASGRRVGHVYPGDGDFTARLTVDDGRGLSDSRQAMEARIRVHRPPRAGLGPPERTVGVGEPLLVSGASSVSSGSVALRYHWDFAFQAGSGDAPAGAGDWEPTAIHSFSEPGIHRVRLTVTDDSGFAHCRTDSAELRVRVTD